MRHTNAWSRYTVLWICTALAISATLLSSVAYAGLGVWTSGGPYGGSVTALAINPTTPTTLYAGTDAGVFKSTDSGGTWAAANTGLTSGSVTALAINPTTPATLYAGTDAGVFKSTDSGGTWAAANTGLTSGSVTALAINPTTPATLYAGTFGGVFKSTDSGGTWVATGLTTQYVYALVINPTTPTTLYAGTSGGGVFKSTDSGATWVATGLTTQYVQALAINPVTPTTLYAAPWRGGVFRSTDSGNTWSATGAGPLYVMALAVNPTTPTTLYSGTAESGVFKSTDSGGTWAAANTGLTSAYVTALAINPTTPATLYAGTDGVFKSTDSGATWVAGNTGLTALRVNALAIDPTTPATLYAGTMDGVFKSTDSGATWAAASTGVTSPTSVGALAINPMTPATLYAGTNGGVFKSTDSGATWVATELTTQYVYALVINPTTPTTLYAGTFGDGVFKSTDSGGTWAAANTGLPQAYYPSFSLGVFALAINPTTPTTLYAGMNRGGVFKSTDSGGTWAAANTGLPQAYPSSFLGVFALAINPTTPTTLYVGTNGGGVFKSTDSGATWVAASTGLTDLNVMALAINPTTPATLYAGTMDGVFKSTTDSGGWVAANTGLTSPWVVQALALDATGATTLFAGFMWGSVWQLTPTPCAGPRPAAVVSGTAAICAGGSTPIQAVLTGTGPWNVIWSDSVVQSGVATSPATRSVSPSSTTPYTVTALTDVNCMAQAGDLTGNAVVTVGQPLAGVVIGVSGATTLCTGTTGGTATVTDSGGGAATHQWGFRTTPGGTITPLAGQTGPNYVITAGDFGPAGTFFLVCTTTPTCGSATVSNEVTVVVSAIPVPIITANGPTTLCAGASVTLSSSSGTAYVWSTGTTTRSITVTASGTYTVTTTVNGCAGTSAPIAVTVNPLPAIPVVTAPAAAYPSKAGLAASVESHAGASYQWSVTNGSITSGQGTSSITFTAVSVGQSVLSVVETSGLGCASAAGVAVVTVGSGIFIPATGGAPNTRVDVPVNVASVSGLAAATLTIGYDPAALRFASVRTGLLTPGWALLANASNPGEVRVALASASGPAAGSGALLYVAFDVIGGPGTTSNLTLSSVSLNDGAIVPDITNGTFRIDALRNVSGTVRHWNKGAGVPGVSLSLSGERVYSTSSSSSGGFTVGGLDGQTYVLEPSKSDGVDGIGTLDASLILQHAVGLTTLTGYAALAADVNGNGSITAMDAFLVLQKTIDAITLPFPGAGRVWAFSPANRSYDPLSADQAGQDFTAILIGDVNGSWGARPPAKTGPVPGAAGPGVASSDVVVKVGDTFSCGAAAIPVAVTVIPLGSKVLGVALKITFDPAAMTISSALATGEAVGWAVASHQPEAGTLLVALAGASELAGPGTILLLSATSLRDGSSVVSLPSVAVNDGEIPASGAPGAVTFTSGVPVLTASYTGPACEGSDVQFSTQVILGASYSWSGPNGFTSSEVLPTLASVTQAMTGKYTVTVSGAGCAPASASTDLVVNAKPATPTIASPSAAVPGTAGLTASVAAHMGSHYQWTIANGSITAGQNTNQITFTAGVPGSVTLRVSETSSAGCASSEASKTVPILPLATTFSTITPCRFFDTRNTSGADAASPALAAQETRTFTIGGRCAVPSAAKVLSVNQTVTEPTAAGELLLYRGDLASAPTASSVRFGAGKTRANNGMVELARDGSGTFKVFNNSAGTVHFILDVNGYFQ